MASLRHIDQIGSIVYKVQHTWLGVWLV
jgi:hypothetical protein